jgi:hypothetical protein
VAVSRIEVVVNLASRPTPRAAIPNIPAPIQPRNTIRLIANLAAAWLPRLPRPATLPATSNLSLLLSALPTLPLLPALSLTLPLLSALTLLSRLLSTLSLLSSLPLLPLLSRLAILPLLPTASLLLAILA